MLGGALNALVITRFGGAPLIVTLGTYSLFRGMAEGLTRGVDNFSQFPPGFLYLGQGYLGGPFPRRRPCSSSSRLLFCAAASQHLRAGIPRDRIRLRRRALGGIPVKRRLALVYTLSGFTAAVASLIYVAHLDRRVRTQAQAMNCSPLRGGAGRTDIMADGQYLGHLLGLCAIVVLQNGLRVSAFPAELAGILTSVILVATIAIGVESRAAAVQRLSQERRKTK